MSSNGLVQIDGLAPLARGERKTSKVMLLFPPEWVPTAPYLALPSLTSVLRRHGHEVIQKDVNIEMYDHFFSDTFLIWVRARLEMQRRALEERERGEGLDEAAVAQKLAVEEKLAWDV